MKVTINKLCVLVFAMAISGITSAQNSETVSASESDSHWLFRLRLIDVVPNANSDTISIIGGKVKSISNSLAPELDINYFLLHSFLQN